MGYRFSFFESQFMCVGKLINKVVKSGKKWEKFYIFETIICKIQITKCSI